MNNKLIGGTLLAAAALVASFEGTKYVAYKDPVGIWTICTGATKDVKRGDTATPKECQDRLIVELLEHAKPLERIPHKLPDHVIVAWADFSYNLGTGTLQRSTGYKLLQQGRWAESCANILAYRFITVNGVRVDCFDDANARTCGGIKKRRTIEYQLCTGSLSVNAAVVSLGT